jgi:hypothetical protein
LGRGKLGIFTLKALPVRGTLALETVCTGASGDSFGVLVSATNVPFPVYYLLPVSLSRQAEKQPYS